MSSGVAKIFMHGRSQAVRLPKEFRLPGKEVRVTRDGDRIILEPVKDFDVKAWRTSLDQLVELHGPFLDEFEPNDPPVQPEDFGWDGDDMPALAGRKP
ncbi:MAG: AbrB/MazE/SpoVT family DNA-binding domain-containing protein [Hyphomicrobium sp.]